ncbi:hypothetical protein D3C87_2178890 [compost metagenome]
MAAAEQLDQEFGHRALERKLADAGIGDNDKARAAKVMERLRARQAGGTTAAAPASTQNP